MGSPGKMERHSGKKERYDAGRRIQDVTTTIGNTFWSLYRTFLSGTLSQLVSPETRKAAFQLFCDMKTNTPKDETFFNRHWNALMPTTKLGWVVRWVKYQTDLDFQLEIICIN